MLAHTILSAAATIFLTAPAWSAADVARGFRLSALCASCHRLDGADKGDLAITGLGAETLTGIMQAYASGNRPSNIMHAVARSLSDDDITALARYLATQPSGNRTR